MKTTVFLCMLSIMFVDSLYGQGKEEVYTYTCTSKTYGVCPLVFIIVDNDNNLAQSVTFHVSFSYRKKKMKSIQKVRYYLDSTKILKLDNGNITFKHYLGHSKKFTLPKEYYSTENFRKLPDYEVYRQYLPELLSLDNYDLLKYLDENFTKYYGPKEYRDVPLLKRTHEDVSALRQQ